MSDSRNEVDQILVDQSVLFARMLSGIAMLGDVQKTIAQSLIDARIAPDHKVLISGNVAVAINALNRASHMIMRANVDLCDRYDADIRDDGHQPH